MKKTIALFAAAAAFVAVAAVAAEPAQAPAAGQSAPQGNGPRFKRTGKLSQLQMKHFGGYIKDTRKQHGEIAIVNAQSAADKAWFQPVITEVNKLVKLAIVVKDGTFDLAKPEVQGNACVFVVDDPKLPMSLFASESRWSMVNVAPLKSGEGAKPQFFQARVQKAVMRQLAFLMGAANSQYPGNLTRCITKAEDYDQFAHFRLPVDILGKFERYVEGYDVTPYALVPYKKAVQEGWGPQPTNEFQKAIWESVHKLPEAPLPLVKPTK